MSGAARLGLSGAPGAGLAALGLVAAAGAWAEALWVALPEELLFRGLLQGELQFRTGRSGIAALLSALAFAAAHAAAGGGSGAWLTFLPGLGFACLRAASRSVWPAVAAHAAANALWLGGLAA